MTTSQAMQTLLDQAEIAQLERDWGLWRDTWRWDKLRDLYAPDARMTTTWMDGTAAEFLAAVIQSAKKGNRGQHFIGASSIAVNGERAIAETRLVLMMRAVLEGIEVDVSCHGRVHDRLVRHDGRWRILRRVPIYEKDRIDSVIPGATIELDPAKLALHPEGYRHLAYMQTLRGDRIVPNLIAPNSPEQARLYAEGDAWLAAG